MMEYDIHTLLDFLTLVATGARRCSVRGLTLLLAPCADGFANIQWTRGAAGQHPPTEQPPWLWIYLLHLERQQLRGG